MSVLAEAGPPGHDHMSEWTREMAAYINDALANVPVPEADPSTLQQPFQVAGVVAEAAMHPIDEPARSVPVTRTRYNWLPLLEGEPGYDNSQHNVGPRTARALGAIADVDEGGPAFPKNGSGREVFDRGSGKNDHPGFGVQCNRPVEPGSTKRRAPTLRQQIQNPW